MESVAAVEVRHELHRVGVSPTVGVGAPHDLVPQAQIDRERTDGRRGARPTGIGRRGLDDDAVVPYRERFRVGLTRHTYEKPFGLASGPEGSAAAACSALISAAEMAPSVGRPTTDSNAMIAPWAMTPSWPGDQRACRVAGGAHRHWKPCDDQLSGEYPSWASTSS